MNDDPILVHNATHVRIPRKRNPRGQYCLRIGGETVFESGERVSQKTLRQRLDRAMGRVFVDVVDEKLEAIDTEIGGLLSKS